jgi:nitrogenase molybdenum-iron protein alpha/beta subunit
MGVDYGTLAIGAVIQGGIGVLIWVGIQRTVERLDKLQSEVAILKDQRVSRIEEAISRGDNQHKEFYERLEDLKSSAVSLTLCRQNHQELAHGQQEFRSAVITLARVQTELQATSKFVHEVNERVLAAREDLAKLEERSSHGRH